MTFSQPLKLFTIGGSLITTNSLWFFDNSKPPIEQNTKKEEPTIEVDLNMLDAIDRLPTRNKKEPLKDEKLTKGSMDSSTSSISFTYKGTTGTKYLSSNPFMEIGNFDMKWIRGTRKLYSTIEKSSIKIQLFDKPAWHNNETNSKDKYGSPLGSDKIEELFQGKDEAKVKQLLLSLQRKREWQYHYHQNENYHYSNLLTWPNTLEELKDLKIKYFKDFDSLKSYVHEKVDACKDDSRACIAHVDELDVMETDLLSFFRN